MVIAENSERPKTTKQIKMAYNIQTFDGTDWECFEQQLECVITLNEVPDDKKVPLLLTKLTPKVLDTLLFVFT